MTSKFLSYVANDWRLPNIHSFGVGAFLPSARHIWRLAWCLARCFTLLSSSAYTGGEARNFYKSQSLYGENSNFFRLPGPCYTGRKVYMTTHFVLSGSRATYFFMNASYSYIFFFFNVFPIFLHRFFTFLHIFNLFLHIFAIFLHIFHISLHIFFTFLHIFDLFLDIFHMFHIFHIFSCKQVLKNRR